MLILIKVVVIFKKNLNNLIVNNILIIIKIEKNQRKQ
jgi:hypothetical protein